MQEKEFSLARLKCEGAPLHPDDIDGDITQEQWERQEAAYNEFHGITYTPGPSLSGEVK